MLECHPESICVTFAAGPQGMQTTLHDQLCIALHCLDSCIALTRVFCIIICQFCIIICQPKDSQCNSLGNDVSTLLQQHTTLLTGIQR